MNPEIDQRIDDRLTNDMFERLNDIAMEIPPQELLYHDFNHLSLLNV